MIKKRSSKLKIAILLTAYERKELPNFYNILSKVSKMRYQSKNPMLKDKKIYLNPEEIEKEGLLFEKTHRYYTLREMTKMRYKATKYFNKAFYRRLKDLQNNGLMSGENITLKGERFLLETSKSRLKI